MIFFTIKRVLHFVIFTDQKKNNVCHFLTITSTVWMIDLLLGIQYAISSRGVDVGGC